jgi:hypothetical protein
MDSTEHSGGAKPTIGAMAKSLSSSMVNWAKAGFSKVPQHVRDSRLSTCRACEYWRGQNFGGLGQCLKCGCSGGKLWLPTEKCPLLKWGVYGALAIGMPNTSNVLTEKVIEINLENPNESKRS